MIGTVYQRKSDGRWVASVSLRRSPRVRRTRYAQSQKDAEKALAELLEEAGLTEEARFWSRVEKTPTCWNWTGTYVNGYGYFKPARGTLRRAHRAAYEFAVGPIPAGLYILHGCNNKRCVRPLHLRPGTQAENMLDLKLSRSGVSQGDSQAN